MHHICDTYVLFGSALFFSLKHSKLLQFGICQLKAAIFMLTNVDSDTEPSLLMSYPKEPDVIFVSFGRLTKKKPQLNVLYLAQRSDRESNRNL